VSGTGVTIVDVGVCGILIDASVAQAIGTWVELIGTLMTGLGLFIAWQRASQVDDRLRESIGNLAQRITQRFTQPKDAIVRPEPFAAELKMSTPWVGFTRDFARFGPYQDQLDALVKEAKYLREYVEWLRPQVKEIAHNLTEASNKFLTRTEFTSGMERELDEVRTSQDRISVRDLRVAIVGLAITAVGIALPLSVRIK
jgi:hypothetical protein